MPFLQYTVSECHLNLEIKSRERRFMKYLLVICSSGSPEAFHHLLREISKVGCTLSSQHVLLDWDFNTFSVVVYEMT